MYKCDEAEKRFSISFSVAMICSPSPVHLLSRQFAFKSLAQQQSSIIAPECCLYENYWPRNKSNSIYAILAATCHDNVMQYVCE